VFLPISPLHGHGAFTLAPVACTGLSVYAPYLLFVTLVMYTILNLMYSAVIVIL
jgi:hypothetical protein